MRLTIFCFLVSAVFPSLTRAQAPVFEFNHADSSIRFNVKASVAIAGTFDKWDASLTFTSQELTTGVLDSQDSGSQREHRKRNEGRQAEGQRLYRPDPTQLRSRATSRFAA
jgi:hypothetical protein